MWLTIIQPFFLYTSFSIHIHDDYSVYSNVFIRKCMRQLIDDK